MLGSLLKHLRFAKIRKFRQSITEANIGFDAITLPLHFRWLRTSSLSFGAQLMTLHVNVGEAELSLHCVSNCSAKLSVCKGHGFQIFIRQKRKHCRVIGYFNGVTIKALGERRRNRLLLHFPEGEILEIGPKFTGLTLTGSNEMICRLKNATDVLSGSIVSDFYRGRRKDGIFCNHRLSGDEFQIDSGEWNSTILGKFGGRRIRAMIIVCIANIIGDTFSTL